MLREEGGGGGGTGLRIPFRFCSFAAQRWSSFSPFARFLRTVTALDLRPICAAPPPPPEGQLRTFEAVNNYRPTETCTFGPSRRALGYNQTSSWSHSRGSDVRFDCYIFYGLQLLFMHIYMCNFIYFPQNPPWFQSGPAVPADVEMNVLK